MAGLQQLEQIGCVSTKTDIVFVFFSLEREFFSECTENCPTN